MEVAICAIARLENRYIREWVDYHLKMGFSHIYLYDNNRENEERLSDVLTEATILRDSTLRGHSDATQLPKIVIIPIHHRSYVQMYAYQDCYDYGDFDWLLYIDIDEFFTFANTSLSVEKWIRQAALKQNADAILINWMCYGDCGHIHYSAAPVVERFPKPLPHWFSPTNAFGKAPENRHVKTMIRKGIDFTIYNPHIGKGHYRTVNADGVEVPNDAQQKEFTFKTVYLRHYVTKTIEEYTLQKVVRQAADGQSVHYPLWRFFTYNRITFPKLLFYHKNNTVYSSNSIIAPPSKNFWIKQIIKMWIIIPLLKIIK